MSQIYNSDKPIVSKENDQFNRYNFSKRIGETILERKNDNGLVLGLFGIWGEGKSSVLNMIEGILENHEEILIIKFNPWRFKDEESLIFNFLENLSETLDYQLTNFKEKIGAFIKKYGSVGSVINLDLSKIGESLSDTQLEELKNRVNEFLKISNKKIVVIIDDIDRLDKNELFAIFKLIKLTGDFSNTYYILSFDDKMVASALSDRYGGKNEKAGYNFLEKIVQVPLRIPKAHSKDILNFTFKLLDQVIEESKLKLSKEESEIIGNTISRYFLHKITTPRLAVRYANSLSFLIPLLKGEVNNTDLILFEAIKIFYPDHYKFIKDNPEYFIETYFYYNREKNSTKVAEIEQFFKDLNSNLSKKDAQSVGEFLKQLFPYLKEAFSNTIVSNLEKGWTKEKKIASPKYFNRYFIYSVPSDQLSDIYFESYMNNLGTKPLKQLIEETKEILDQIDPVEYLNKIHFFEDSLDWESKKALIKILVSTEKMFSEMKGGTFMFSLYNPKSQAATTIRRLLASHSVYDEKFEVGKELLSKKVPFKFSEEILRWFKIHQNEDDRLFEESDLKLLNKKLLQRALSKCKEKSSTIFEEFEESIFTLLRFWYQTDQKALHQYFKELLAQNPIKIKDIIFSLTSSIISSNYPDPYKTDFKKETFDNLKLYYDVEEIFQIIQTHFNSEIEKVESEVEFFDTDKGQTKLNAMRQFLYWYDQDKKEADDK